MPLFEYRCPECQVTFEKLLGKPEESRPCPQCGKPAPRVVSAFSTGHADPVKSGGCSPASGSGFS